MAKGDDALRKKKNKVNRKKMNKDSSQLSARIAAVIAAKKRRKSGSRRMCQGMCFSLPTPEDPFNDRKGKMDTKSTETKKLVSSPTGDQVSVNGCSVSPRKKGLDRNHTNTKPVEEKMKEDMNLRKKQKSSFSSVDNTSLAPIDKTGQKITVKREKAKISLVEKTRAIHPQLERAFENSGCPSKFLILCLNSIQNALRHGETLTGEDEKPLFVDAWGVEFWKYYSVGKNVLETSRACSTVEQIAWMVSTGADTIARKEKEGLSVTTPFLLFLVTSQEKATMVRSVCKPLKALGVHTVSLHPGASLDHQIHGLKSCEPEFLVSTPERLLELLSLKAIDISGVSLLVVDGLETLFRGGYLDTIKSIREAISGDPHTVVFNDCLDYACIPTLRKLFHGSVSKLSLDCSLASQSACIIQSVHVCVLQEEKLTRAIQVLDQACCDRLATQLSKVLFIVGKNSIQQVVTTIKLKGYSVSTKGFSSNSEVQNSKKKPAVFVIDMEDISTNDIGEFELVILHDFVHSIENYVRILTRMARCTVDGTLHSFLTREDSGLKEPLVGILEQCGQEVPEVLRNLSHSCSTLSES